MSIYLFTQIVIKTFKLLVIVLFSLMLSIMFDSVKQSFLDKLQAKKTLVKNKMCKILSLFFTTSTKSIYDIVVAKKINNCLNNIIDIQITKVAKKNAQQKAMLKTIDITFANND